MGAEPPTRQGTGSQSAALGELDGGFESHGQGNNPGYATGHGGASKATLDSDQKHGSRVVPYPPPTLSPSKPAWWAGYAEKRGGEKIMSIFVEVKEVLSPWGSDEHFEYNPKKHWQIVAIAQSLGFEVPSYPATGENGLPVIVREVSRVDLGSVREKLTDEGAFSQYGNVQRWRVIRESITFSGEGYYLKQWEEEESQVIGSGVTDDAYPNGVGRWADHR